MRHTVLCLIALLLASLFAAAAPGRAGDAITRVSINGVMTPVHFNDGDSFRIEGGAYTGAKTRLAGYNSLESFGPVHEWGEWTPKELYAVAKMAMLTARRGTWSCDGDGKLDSYGRMLLFCRDLAKDLIAKGLAHAYSIDDKPADPELLEAQRQAQNARLGMWAHGIPQFIVTSLHSKAEGGGSDGETSNRLISTGDGHTEKWLHNDDYAECQRVCHHTPAPTEPELDAVVAALRADAATGARLNDLDAAAARARVGAWLAGAPDAGDDVRDALGRLRAEGKLLMSAQQPDSCQLYVDFRRRYGGDKATCLR